MSDLLQCYSVDPALLSDRPGADTHDRVRSIGTFLNGPQISFRCPPGDWIEATLLAGLMDRAAEAMETSQRHVISFSAEQAGQLLEQLHAAIDGEGGEDDPEFIDELINAAEAVVDTNLVLWIGI